MPTLQPMRIHSPSKVKTKPYSARHSPIARSAMAWNTGAVLVGEREMARRISLVAVCFSSASCVSLNSRAFWIAITAWSAKVWSSST